MTEVTFRGRTPVARETAIDWLLAQTRLYADVLSEVFMPSGEPREPYGEAS